MNFYDFCHVEIWSNIIMSKNDFEFKVFSRDTFCHPRNPPVFGDLNFFGGVPNTPMCQNYFSPKFRHGSGAQQCPNRIPWLQLITNKR